VPEAVSKIVDSYRRAMLEHDYPSKSGILIGLMRMLVRPSWLEEDARATAEEIIRIQDEEEA